MRKGWICWLSGLLIVNLVLSEVNGWTPLGLFAVVALALALGVELAPN